MKLSIEVLICTIDDGILRIPDVLQPATEGLTWLVSFQYTEEKWLKALPAELSMRPDVRVLPWKGVGLAANRNHALQHAQGDILLIADDDVKYLSGQLVQIHKVYEDAPSLDIACFQAQDFEGKPLKEYPSEPFWYEDMPKGHWFSSWEITLRRTALPLAFDERFGLGTPFLGAGEEEVFLWKAYRQGRKIKYVPIPIVQTCRETTGSRFFQDKNVQRAKGGVLCVMHGPWGAWLRCVKFSFTHHQGHNPLALLWQMWRGIYYVWRS